jgi:hypothetical protein
VLVLLGDPDCSWRNWKAKVLQNLKVKPFFEGVTARVFNTKVIYFYCLKFNGLVMKPSSI